MQTATIKAQRPSIKRVIRLSTARSPIGQLCNLSFASVEKPALRKKPKKRVIEKLLPAVPKATSPKVVRTRGNNDSRLAECLLADVKAIFKLKKVAQLRTQSILDALCDDKKKPWATLCNGKSINGRRLSSMLMPYGIHSKDLRFADGGTFKAFKGYKREWFVNACHSAN